MAIDLNIAERRIKKPLNINSLVSSEYYTDDIMRVIFDVYKDSYLDVLDFAKTIKYNSIEDLASQLFFFVMNNIKYREDPEGLQKVKRPSVLFANREGDCKSMTIFIASVLRSLGIDCIIRFTSYSMPLRYTHVYAIAIDKRGKQIIIDTVYKIFNSEKKYKFKKDYFMKGLYKVSGLGTSKSLTELNFSKPVDQLSDADMEAEIARQRLEIEKEIVAEIHGIGSRKVQEYQNVIDALNGFIGAMNRGDENEMAAIIGKTKPKSKAGKFLKKLATGVKKVTKAVTKVATAPARLGVKAMIEVALPSAAPAFIYAFINDPAIIAKLPEKMRKKRAMQTKILDVIVNIVGMKREHLMGILRNGIMKRTKKSPEAKLAEILKKKGITGIGIAPVIIGAVMKIIGLIVKLAGKKKSGVDDVQGEDVAPDDEDMSELSESAAAEIAVEVKQQPDNVPVGESIQSEQMQQTIAPNGGKSQTTGIC